MKALPSIGLLCLTAFCSSGMFAQVLFVVPAGYGTTTGNREMGLPFQESGGNAAPAVTLQYTIPASDMSSLAGQTLYGMTFRLNHDNDPVAGAFSYTNYSIELSGSAQGSDLGRTFANNITGNDVIVRSGPLSFEANAFPRADSSPPTEPNNFGPVIEFTTPYTYLSGALLVTLRISGLNGLPSGQPFSADAVLGGGNFFYDDTSASATQGLSPSAGNYIPVMAFTTTSAIPEPSTYAAIFGSAVLGLAFIRRRRRAS